MKQREKCSRREFESRQVHQKDIYEVHRIVPKLFY
jgi:hypothetical protein